MVDDTNAFLLTLISILKDDYDTLAAKSGEDGLNTA